MKLSIQILAILLFIPFLSHANYSEIREVENFTKIDFEGYGELVLISGTAPSVELETDGHRRSLRHIYTKVKNETLYIDQEVHRSYNWFDFRKSDIFVTIYVTYVELESVDLEGKINVISDKVIQANRFEMDLEGYITGDLEFDTNELIIDSEGFTHLDIFGKTNLFDVDHEGIGRIDALDLESSSCVASVEGRASIYVNATDELEADSNGFSKIMYRGRPERIDFDRSAFSKIRRY